MQTIAMAGADKRYAESIEGQQIGLALADAGVDEAGVIFAASLARGEWRGVDDPDRQGRSVVDGARKLH